MGIKLGNSQVINLTEQDRLRQNYFDYLRDAASEFDTAIEQLLDGPSVQAYPYHIADLAHRIKGNAAMYGYSHLGDLAKHAEAFLKAPYNTNTFSDAMISVMDLVETIKEICCGNSKYEPGTGLKSTLAAQAYDNISYPRDISLGLGRKSILIVYKDRNIRELMASILGEEFEVYQSSNLGQARSTLEAVEPDLVIMEQDLDGETGLQFVKELKSGAAFRFVPVFLVFEDNDFDSMAEAVSLGVEELCDDPRDVLEISQKARSYLDKPAQTILIVDDDPTVQDLLKHILSVQGFVVDLVSDGIEALTYLSEMTPDLIILDRFMPRLGGDTVLYEIRSKINLKSIPVLVLTAMVNAGEAQSWLEKGAADFIPKPFDPEEVAMRVLRQLDRKKRW